MLFKSTNSLVEYNFHFLIHVPTVPPQQHRSRQKQAAREIASGLVGQIVGDRDVHTAGEDVATSESGEGSAECHLEHKHA